MGLMTDQPPPSPPPADLGAPPPAWGSPPAGWGSPPPGWGSPPPGWGRNLRDGAPPPGWGGPPPGWGTPPGWGSQPGWNPGHIPAQVGSGRFRSMSVGEWLDATFTMYRRNFVLIASISAVVQIPYAVLTWLLFEITGVATFVRSPFASLNTTQTDHAGAGAADPQHRSRRARRLRRTAPGEPADRRAARRGRDDTCGQRSLPRPPELVAGGVSSRTGTARRADHDDPAC